LLVLGLILFGTAFGVYARFLGWIDGLPQLPEEMLVRRADNEPFVVADRSRIENKLQQAFGGDCPESTTAYSIKLELPSKGIVLAASQYFIDPDGRVRLTPFSLATFKERPGEFPEINAVHCDIAYLEFDKPVKYLNEIGTRRIVACELASDPHLLSHDPRRGQVHIHNNRATPSAADDMVLETPGPVFYREASQPNLPPDKARPQIWTGAAVRLVDGRDQPQATTITAQGMQVYLAIESPDPPPGPGHKPKPRGSAVTGVRRVVLPSNVRMDLWMDPKDGFLTTGTAKAGTAATPQAAPAERRNVQITTLGPFTYDVLPDADRARFDRLPPTATQLPSCVQVVRPQVREPGAQLNDQLECDTLELQFAHKTVPDAPTAAAAAKPKPVAGADRPAIDWAHAWGQLVVLTSDEERLDARGTDLFHDARAKTTTLKGSPEMVAVKDGHEIHAPVLVLYGAESKEGQQAQARGAGYFRLRDQTGAEPRTVEARWRELMVYRKDNGRDLLTLTREAVFEDRANGQALRADQIKLLLAPDPKAADPKAAAAAKPPAKPEAATAARPLPQRLEALGHVTARSPELTVHDTEQLVLLFTDAPPPRPGTTPARAAAPPLNAYQAGKPAASASAPGGPPSAAVAPAAPGAAPRPAPPAPPARKPIDLAARSVQAFIIREGEQNQLDNVHCEDNVRVHQDPPTPQEKPIDMRGRTLRLKHKPEGNVLVVTGSPQAPGEVHMPDLSLLGPNITIDQVENTAEVLGIGSMRMASTTDFEGKKLSQPADLTVTWKEKMRFTGQHALFTGFVHAEQEDTSLLCQTMQVFLNRPVSLAQRTGEARAPGAAPASVDKVVCDNAGQPQPVSIEKSERDARGRLVHYQRLESGEVALYKEEGRMDAGRGIVRLLQLGPKGEPGVGPQRGGPDKRPPPGPAKPPEEEYKLTLVRYNGSMKVNNPNRTVHFFDDVEVLHLPADDPSLQHRVFDQIANKLPAGALYLHCSKLTVYSPKDAQGQTRQQMTAEGKASVQWQNEFYGIADVIKFDEASDKIILEGLDGNYAVVQKLRATANDNRIVAKKIIYNRKTGDWSTDRVFSISGN
jgi:lipopolysaccharide export system protein LptA